MKKLIFFDADGEGGGGDTGVKFSASSVSTRLDEIIGQKNSMYTEMSGLTDTVNSKVSNDGTGVLMGAVGDLKADWQAFQTIYNEFSDQLDAVKKAVVQAGDDYDAFNKGILGTFAGDGGGGSNAPSIQKPSATNAMYTAQ